MNQLVIKLKGEIQSSNFEEWKNDLIAQIQSTTITLVTDDDFVSAIEHVKLFKTAEKALKEAKQSAIDQAADIQKLFAAIDEISEETRQARLKLDRQIKARKLEIKEEFIQSGMKSVRDHVCLKSDDFQRTDLSAFLDRRRFESAIKGKASTKGMESGIKLLCTEIKSEISKKAAEVDGNAERLDALPGVYKILFQDRNSLLSLTGRELNLTIEKRIAKFNEENSKIKAEKAMNELKMIEDYLLNPEESSHPDNSDIMQKERFRIVIELLSSKETAIETAREVRQAYGDNPSISDIRLSRVRDCQDAFHSKPALN